MALAGCLRSLTALRLSRAAGAPHHAETPAPGGGAGALGAGILAAGAPALAELALAGCRVDRDGLLELLTGLQQLRALDLSGGPRAARAPYACSAPVRASGQSHFAWPLRPPITHAPSFHLPP